MRITLRTVGCWLVGWLLMTFPFGLSGCAAVKEIVGGFKPQAPQVRFVGAKLDKLSLDSAGLLFDIAIENPNQVGITLAGFDYDLQIDGNSFLIGQQSDRIQMAAGQQSHLPLPLTLSYASLYESFKKLVDQDTSQYQLRCHLTFDVPILGQVDVPLQKTGKIPLLKVPSLNVEALKLDKLGFTGADLSLNLQFRNPNAFAILLDRFQYKLTVDQKEWTVGETTETVKIDEKDGGLLTIPIHLNFLDIGQSAYGLLKGKDAFDCRLRGGIDLTASIPLLGKIRLPFDLAGRLRASE